VDKSAELENAEVVRMAPNSVPQRRHNYGTRFIYTLS
jgi:hypothetical protein